MSSVLEITQLTNGDVVLRDAEDDGQPMVSIRFSDPRLADSHPAWRAMAVLAVSGN